MTQSSLASRLGLASLLLSGLAALAALAACDGDDAPVDAPLSDGIPVDAPIDTAQAIDAPMIDAPMIDGRPSTVVVVTCPATVASEVSAPGFAFTITDATINVGDTVLFTMPSSHSAVSGPPGQPDGIFQVDFDQSVCLRFTAPGSFPFYCNPHQFTGLITVAGV